jgi:cytoskeletal protein CcmA (bactofilin family)
MFGRKNTPMPPIDMDKVDSIIGKGTEIKGNINASGVLRIDGKIEGGVKTVGDLIVGDTGVVSADISARHITVAGEVRGNITAQGKLELTNTAKVFGDVKVQQLNISDGALFDGKCEMKKEDSKLKTGFRPAAVVEKE